MHFTLCLCNIIKSCFIMHIITLFDLRDIVIYACIDNDILIAVVMVNIFEWLNHFN